LYRATLNDPIRGVPQRGQGVVIVDPVTTRSANLFAELARRLGGPATAVADASIYAVSCRVSASASPGPS
jgi:hypothetical protein